MEKNVIISIRGVQTYDDTDDQVIELVTEGCLTPAPDGYKLSYEESKLTGLEGTLTTFDISDHIITLTRTGELMSRIVFEEGRKHYSVYETAFGSLTVGIAAGMVEHNMNESGGNIAIDYAVEIDCALAGSNSFRISVRENGGHSPEVS